MGRLHHLVKGPCWGGGDEVRLLLGIVDTWDMGELQTFFLSMLGLFEFRHIGWTLGHIFCERLRNVNGNLCLFGDSPWGEFFSKSGNHFILLLQSSGRDLIHAFCIVTLLLGNLIVHPPSINSIVKDLVTPSVNLEFQSLRSLVSARVCALTAIIGLETVDVLLLQPWVTQSLPRMTHALGHVNRLLAHKGPKFLLLFYFTIQSSLFSLLLSHQISNMRFTLADPGSDLFKFSLLFDKLLLILVESCFQLSNVLFDLVVLELLLSLHHGVFHLFIVQSFDL